MIYLSSTTGIDPKYKWDEFGIMFSSKYKIGGLKDALDEGARWMMDNNQFTGDFNAKTWISSLIDFLPYQKTCIGIPVPDKVADCLGTLRMFSRYFQIVRDLGYPVAFVSQDGITPEMVPWDYMDVLFVGGTNEHKLYDEATLVIAEAKAREKWVHVGRVNSFSRIDRFWMVDSVDGTGLSIDAGNKRAERVNEYAVAVSRCRHRKSGKLDSTGQYTLEIA